MVRVGDPETPLPPALTLVSHHIALFHLGSAETYRREGMSLCWGLVQAEGTASTKVLRWPVIEHLRIRMEDGCSEGRELVGGKVRGFGSPESQEVGRSQAMLTATLTFVLSSCPSGSPIPGCSHPACPGRPLSTL